MVLRNAPQALPRAPDQFDRRDEQQARDMIEKALDRVTRSLSGATDGAFLKATDTSDDITEGATNLFMTSSERAAVADAFLKSNDDSDDVTEGATNLFVSAAERARLGRIFNRVDGARHVLYCKFDGVNGATTSADDSASRHMLSFVANAQIDTAQKKFGDSSLLLDGAGDLVALPEHEDFDIAAGEPFTAHAQVRLTSLPSNQGVFGRYLTTGNQRSYLLSILTTGAIQWLWSPDGTGGAVVTVTSATGLVSTGGSFSHIAVTRDELGHVRILLDGNVVATGTDANLNTASFASTARAAIGANHNTASSGFTGNIDQFEFIKGAALWFADFDAPTIPGDILVSGVATSKIAHLTPQHVPPSNIIAGSAAATLRYNLIGATNLRGLPQGLAVDEVNRHLYILMGDPLTIQRFDLDGPLQQVADEATADTTVLGHQGLAVENLVDGTSKLWATSDDPGYAIRFTFVSSAEPDESEKYRFFDDDSYADCSYAISSDGRYLIGVQPSQSASYWQPEMVRVWVLSDVVAVGAGDHRDTWLYQWRPAADQFPLSPEDYPFQACASDGAYLYIVSGYVDTDYPPKIYAYDIATGDIALRADDVITGAADAAFVEGGEYNEPEGLAMIRPDKNGPPAVALLLGQGETTGVRSKRVYILGHDTHEGAEMSWRRLNAALPSTIISLHRSFYRSIMDDLWANDIMNKLAFLYFTANVTEAAACINWVRPGSFTLSPVSGAVFTAWDGYVGDGSADYLNTGVTPHGLPNYEKGNAHVGAYILGNVAGTTAVGLSTSADILMQPRTAGGNFSSRLNQSTVNNVANTDGSGYTLINRLSLTGYDRYRNNSLFNSVTQTANSLPSSATFTLLHGNGAFSAAGATLAVAHAGLGLDDDRRDAMSAIITRWMAEAAGF